MGQHASHLLEDPAQNRARRQREQSLELASALILPESTVYTDEYSAYNNLSGLKKECQPLGYQHKRIHRASKVYVVADVHTNTVSSFRVF